MNAFSKRILFLFFSFSPLLCLQAQLEVTKFSITDGMNNSVLKSTMEANLSTLLTLFNSAAMNNGELKLNSKQFTKNAQSSIAEIWKSSGMVCPLSLVEEKCIKLSSGGYEVRNIPVTMLEADEDLQEQEIVIEFDKNGLINDLSIAVESQRYNDILAENESVLDLNRRQVVLNFIETFRTAYNRKDITFLNNVYSDNALIITGRIVKVKEEPKTENSTMLSLGKQAVEYQRQTKSEYINKLKSIFSKTKYLNVTFDELEVMKHPKYDNIYGVTLKQNWHTNTYSDEGFLFLMIDFKDELHPLIQVRTWQPYKLNNKVLPRDEVFHLGSFNIVQ